MAVCMESEASQPISRVETSRLIVRLSSHCHSNAQPVGRIYRVFVTAGPAAEFFRNAGMKKNASKRKKSFVRCGEIGLPIEDYDHEPEYGHQIGDA